MNTQRPTEARRTDQEYSDPSERPPPVQEKLQPDPMLGLGRRRVQAGGLALAAIVAAAILYVVLYGLNSPNPPNHPAALPPPAQSAKPQAGGNSGAATPGPPRANESGVKG
jgi:hypothetical protein